MFLFLSAVDFRLLRARLTKPVVMHQRSIWRDSGTRRARRALVRSHSGARRAAVPSEASADIYLCQQSTFSRIVTTMRHQLTAVAILMNRSGSFQQQSTVTAIHENTALKLVTSNDRSLPPVEKLCGYYKRQNKTV